MIAFDAGDDLALLVDTARKFAFEALRPRLREAERARGVASAVREDFDAIGLAGLEWPEDADGAGLGPLARALVNEELGAADAGAALALDRTGPALYAVLEAGDAAASAAFREGLAAPGARAAFLDATVDSVALRGDRLEAEVPWLPSDRADVVVALLDDEMLLVREGIATRALAGSGLRAAGACALRLEDAPIAARHRRPGAGARARARARLYAASLLLGVLRDACDFSRAYAMERQAFGRPIAHHQALAFLIVDMQMALDGARLLVHEAAWRVERGLPCAGEAAAAFAQCIEASRLIGPAGVQILGGHGFMADYPMEKAMREARALGLWLGGFDAAIDDAGRALAAVSGPALELGVVDFSIDARTRERLEEAREWGRSAMRPAGLEADRLGAPLPVDHPYFAKFLERGGGRTRWTGPAGRERDAGEPTSVLTTLLLLEELAYWDRGVTVADPGPGLPETNVLAMGTEAQKERYLGPFLAPDRPRWACFGMTEPGAGSDAAAIQTTARRDGDGWILDGAKCFIGGASRADWILVQATLDASKGRAAQRAFFVERGTPGLGDFKIEKKMGLKAYESTSFTLRDCRVPAANLLGGERKDGGGGFRTAMATFNAGRPIIAANAVGMGRAALDEALAFARERDLLAGARMRDRLEAMARKLRMARLVCLRAGWLAEQQRPNIVEASMAKALAAGVAQEVTTLGMELLGAVGARGDHLIEKLYRDVKAMDIVEGTGQIQRVIIARKLVGLPR